MSANKILFIPGLKPVLEALSSNPAEILEVFLRRGLSSPESKQILALCEKNGVPVGYRDGAGLDKLCAPSRNVGHQGVVARAEARNFLPLSDLLRLAPEAPLPLVLALDQVQDPGNLGTLCRAAYALGCAGLVLPSHNSALAGPGALRSSAGALRLLPIAESVNLARALDDAAELGFAVCAASGASAPDRDAFLFEWPFPAVLVLGNEAKGIRPGVLKRCEQKIAVPFARKFDSLNVAVAGAILISLAAAQLAKTPRN